MTYTHRLPRKYICYIALSHTLGWRGREKERKRTVDSQIQMKRKGQIRSNREREKHRNRRVRAMIEERE